jgi:hypothetical protein
MKLQVFRTIMVLIIGFSLHLTPGNEVNGQRRSNRKSEQKTEQKSEQKNDLVEFSGYVRDLQHNPLSNVNIIILNDRRGTTSDFRGMFSFVVHSNDTILFSHMGHKGTIHVIPDSLDGQQYPADIFMVSDTFQLAEVRIYPWKTYQEFKEAFLALDRPDDDEQRAYHNIALIKTQIKMNRNGVSNTPTMAFREVMKQQYNQLYTAGQSPYYTIFDPLRWAKFFEAVKSGDFKEDD